LERSLAQFLLVSFLFIDADGCGCRVEEESEIVVRAASYGRVGAACDAGRARQLCVEVVHVPFCYGRRQLAIYYSTIRFFVIATRSRSCLGYTPSRLTCAKPPPPPPPPSSRRTSGQPEPLYHCPSHYRLDFTTARVTTTARPHLDDPLAARRAPRTFAQCRSICFLLRSLWSPLS
jgi:hypothetical protein